MDACEQVIAHHRSLTGVGIDSPVTAPFVIHPEIKKAGEESLRATVCAAGRDPGGFARVRVVACAACSFQPLLSPEVGKGKGPAG